MSAYAVNFARTGLYLMLAKAEGENPCVIAERKRPGDGAELERMMKAAVPASDTNGALFAQSAVISEFADSVRAAALLGQIKYQRVPFSTSMPFLSAVTEFDFVGEGRPIPALSLQFNSPLLLKRTKISGIVVITNELLRAAGTSAESLINREMKAACVAAADRRLLDPAYDGNGVGPASITYDGSSPPGAVYDATGAADATDVDGVVADLLAQLAALGSNLANVIFITDTATAIALAGLRESGVAAYDITTAGGTLGGVPLLVSGSAPPHQLTALDAQELLVANDGEFALSTTTEALIDQSSVPVGATPISLFQEEATGLRVTWFVNWAMRHPYVAYAANFEPVGPSFSGSP